MEDKFNIKRKSAYLDVPHDNESLRFLATHFGLGDYKQIGDEIRSRGLIKPTIAQNASLIKEALEDTANDIIWRLGQHCGVWAFNGLLYVPKEGVYIQDRPQINNLGISMEKSDLIKMLEANDPSVRFVPFGFKTGEQTPQELATNQFVVGLAGEDGAEKLAEIALNFRLNPIVSELSDDFCFRYSTQPETRVASLSSAGGINGCIRVGGSIKYDPQSFYSNMAKGYAFGILDSKRAA